MGISFSDYTAFGHRLIPEGDFNRWMTKAVLYTESITLQRVTNEFLGDGEGDPVWKERNRRGVCEIADILYKNDLKPVGESGAVISSFKNEGYSETYADLGTARKAFKDSMDDVLTVYFKREQLYRGNL